MYVTNRKHGYKVIKTIKKGNRVQLTNIYGAIFEVTAELLEQHGYKFTRNKPAAFSYP